jgi:hypothetical protein
MDHIDVPSIIGRKLLPKLVLSISSHIEIGHFDWSADFINH